MTALIRPVTYVWPALTSAVGCSETLPLGSIQETAGSVPFLAAAKKFDRDWMLPSSPSWATSLNDGSGFQIPGVFGPCCTGAQVIELSDSQSGSVPWNT